MKESLFQILHLGGQRLLRSTPRAGIPQDRPVIDHDRESKAGMSLGLRHKQFRSLIDGVVGTVPGNDHTVDSAADHVLHLALNLCRIRGTVPDIDMARMSPPHPEGSVNLGCR